MHTTVVLVFALVYLGMILGGLPRLALDRTGVALLGAIVLIASGDMSLAAASAAVDGPTLALLFGLMIVSAQFRLGGFYTHLTRNLAGRDGSPEKLLAVLVATAGGLSALLANDIVCLAMAPILVEVCARRRLDPVPFLLALACAANVGSAATLIGNPQNMLIGETLRLSFGGYLLDAFVPAALGLAATWWIRRGALASVSAGAHTHALASPSRSLRPRSPQRGFGCARSSRSEPGAPRSSPRRVRRRAG